MSTSLTEAAFRYLAEVFRVLKPGGRVRVSTPDAEKIVGLYAREKTDAQSRYLDWAARRSMGLYADEKSLLQQRKPEWDIPREHFDWFFPDPVRDGAGFVVNNFFRSYGHRFLYDERTLSGALRASGFVDMRRYEPGESDDDRLRNLESHGQVIGDEMNRFETMVVEAVKPGRAPHASP